MALPEIRLMQAAIALAEELNFSRAAERLHVSQPTLSKQIVELESQLGFRLFERNHQIVELMDAGRMFVEEAREAVLHTERAVLSAKAVSTGPMKFSTLENLLTPTLSWSRPSYRCVCHSSHA
jgi:DNA-binding transcriptional LysR family regulator